MFFIKKSPAKTLAGDFFYYSLPNVFCIFGVLFVFRESFLIYETLLKLKHYDQ